MVVYLFAIFSVVLPVSAAIFNVVLDPGHGGSDEGTVFTSELSRIAEKEVTLQLAQQVAQQLRAKGFRVTLTRTEDKDVSLPARTALANRLGADVFISIHMNSVETSFSNDPSLYPEGIETYILNNATDASSKRLARLENSVISKSPSDSPEQLDIALILKDLRLDANLSASKRLACHIQGNLVSATSHLVTGHLVSGHLTTGHLLPRKRNRGVKQALFHVLLGADMPSVLVEAGFLSNPHDRALVLSRHGQLLMSQAIALAIDQYRHQKAKTSFHLSKCKIN